MGLVKLLDVLVLEAFKGAPVGPLEFMLRMFTPPTAITRLRGDGAVIDADDGGFWTTDGIVGGAGAGRF